MAEKIGNSEYFRQIAESLKDSGFPQPTDRVRINIPNAEHLLKSGIQYIVKMKSGNDAMWCERNYRPIVDWLTDNKGKGLLMCGSCGLGKTVIGMYILPLLINKYCRKIVRIYTAQDMNKHIDEVLTRHIIYIDDVGTEDNLNSFGNKRMPFSELCDAAEKQGKLLIISTNLNVEQLTKRYGDRTIDRLVATTKFVPFIGKSLRK